MVDVIATFKLLLKISHHDNNRNHLQFLLQPHSQQANQVDISSSNQVHLQLESWGKIGRR